MTEFLLAWMADGRAYAGLPAITDPRVAPTELRTSATIGTFYRRRLPVLGQPDARETARADLRARGEAASAALRARYEATYGPYEAPPSVARAAARLAAAAKRRGVSEAREAAYQGAVATYRAARFARGASPAAVDRALARYAA